jgi:hypothetical protein
VPEEELKALLEQNLDRLPEAKHDGRLEHPSRNDWCYAETLAYELHYRSYRPMGAIFGRALCEAKKIPANNDAEFQELMRDLGREALAENAEWLLDHRYRPIKHQ